QGVAAVDRRDAGHRGERRHGRAVEGLEVRGLLGSQDGVGGALHGTLSPGRDRTPHPSVRRASDRSARLDALARGAADGRARGRRFAYGALVSALLVGADDRGLGPGAAHDEERRIAARATLGEGTLPELEVA